MSSADRVSELLDKWLTSLELHAQYAQLSDLAYSCVQPWPKHDRPTRWVVQIAREKALLLKQHCQARHAAGDEQFAESLELMLTLANLVGLQHIQRFIPLADPARANPIPSEQPANTPDFAALVRAADDATEGEPTRELPRLEEPVSAVRMKPAAAARQARQAAQRDLNTPAMLVGASARPAASQAPAASTKAKVTTPPTHSPNTAGAAKQSMTAAVTPAQTVNGRATTDAAAPRATTSIAAKSLSAKSSSSANTNTASAQAAITPANTPTTKKPIGSVGAGIATDPSRTKPAAAKTGAAIAPTGTNGTISDTQEMPRPINPPMPATKVPTRNAAPAVSASAEPAALSPAEHIVITDAIRFLKWGKPWHELAELVSRIADRPGITQVRRILRTHRTDIEARAGAE